MPQRTAASDGSRLAALGSLIWRDPALLLATAARAGADSRSTMVECRLRGASMATAIPAGSRVRIACGQHEPRIGDVVAFAIDERIVVHRVVYRRWRAGRGATFLTRGDAMLVPDPPLGTPALIGRVLEFDGGSGWKPVGLPGWTPRRDRVVAFAVLAASAALFEFSVHAARWFIGGIDKIGSRLS
jgi:hypothetical protein